MIYYILGGTILVTFIACLIHYFASDSNLSDFFTEKFGWITISMCLTVGLCVIGCIYWELWMSLILGVTVICAFCFCIYYYNDQCCYSLRDFFVDEYGWVIAFMFLACGFAVVGMVYWHFWWSVLILSTVGASVAALTTYYDESAARNLYELFVEESGWVFPLLFVSIASTIACSILFDVGHSLIIGLTVIIMLIASIIHYSSQMCSSFKGFFIDENGWVTNLIVFTIGATVYGCVYGSLGQSLYIGISAMVLIIACIIHYTSSYALNFEDFFTEEKGWLTISTALLIEASIYGFIFWSPAKTFIVICTFIAMVVGAVVHWNVTKSTKFGDFFYFDNGYLTVSVIIALGYGIYALAYYSIIKAIIAILALCFGILGTAIYKAKANERYFATFYAIKLGALAVTIPTVIGGLLIGILYSSWAYLIVFGLIDIISYLCALFKALSNKNLYFPPKPKPIPKPIPKPMPTPTPTPTPTPKPMPKAVTPSPTQTTSEYDEPVIVEATGKTDLYISTEDK